MKLFPANMLSPRARATKPAVSAFTVVEMVTVAAIFALVIIWLVELQIFALRMYTLAATKTTATQTGRQALNKMRDAIRSANTTDVGTYNPTNGGGFIQASNGAPQTGNALLLTYLDIDGNLTITNLFYLDTTQPVSADQPYDFPLCSLISIGSNSVSTNLSVTTSLLANYVTNYYIFSAEDYQGNFLSNSSAYLNNGVIHITMQFDQWEYPIGFIGSNAVNAYDFYRLTSRVTRRCKQ
jgi:hypothetical protein